MVKDTPNKEHYYPFLRKRIATTNGLGMNTDHRRNIFATYLRNSGIEPGDIDLLQGRISLVFVNHYYRPDINEIIAKKVRPALNSLTKAIE